MILREFTSADGRKLKKLNRALAENYDYRIDFKNMTEARAARIAAKAYQKIEETRDTTARVKYGMIAESLDLWMQANVQSELTSYNLSENLDDDSMEEAKVILAAKELSDKIQGMIEDAAKMQVQDLLPIVDAMRNELGSAEADSFSSAADQALGNLVETLKTSKEEYDSAIRLAQGEAPASDMDDFDSPDADADMDLDVDMDGGDGDLDMDMDDEFDGDEASVGDEDPTGREMKAEM